MSLINDALKRARQAQQNHPPAADGPALRPAEPAESKAASGAKTLIFIMVVCVIAGNALLFLAVKDRGAKKEAVAAVPSAPSATVTTVAAVAAPVVAAAPQPATAPAIAAAPALQPATGEAAPVVVAESATAAAPSATETNPVVVAPAVVFENPKPAPLKLQSIIYNPARPSAMIGGKFLYLGDRIQGFRVTIIDQESVTLIGNGQTNVLSLP